MTTRPLSLFEGWGIEIEYMIVDRDSLDVRPIADEVLRSVSGADDWVEDLEDGGMGWSNELVCHLLEVKNVEPVRSLEGLAGQFEKNVARLNECLSQSGAQLMPTGMHPWMDPGRETRIWPHESAPIYNAYDRLFDCRRHGWANVQSVHLNLPFADEFEFSRLMAAVRIVLPLIPGLAASSPVVEGSPTGLLDNRLEFYRTNAVRAPSMTGNVVPEAIFRIQEYRDQVLDSIARELAELGSDPLLQGPEWTNARGAIARFDRMAIEIRLIDSQECPKADLAVSAAIGGAVRALVDERWSSFRDQCAYAGEPLVELLADAVELGPEAVITDTGYGPLFGDSPSGSTTVGTLWRRLAEQSFGGPAELEEPLAVVLRGGVLARRILEALGGSFDRNRLREVYDELAHCLASGQSYVP